MTKRKSEFVAGRYLAKLALMSLGADKTSVDIKSTRDPLWPESFIGSITHSRGVAVCAVAHSDDSKRIGIDIENFLDVKVAEDIVCKILVRSEYDLVNSCTNFRHILITLIFSAKESLFKALFPEVGHHFGFYAAQVRTIDFHTGSFTLELVQELSPSLPIGSCFQGTYNFYNNQVFTVVSSK